MNLFFYGTLIAGGGNRVADRVHRKLRAIGPATVRGALHAIADPRGWYPALLPGEAQVRGMLYRAEADFGAEDLAALDRYEDHDPADAAGSLYLRLAVQARRPDGEEVPAQAYRFNRPLPAGSRPIAGGDFLRWLDAHGLRAFAPGSGGA